MMTSNLFDPAGNLYWYRHTGQQNGTTDWSERKEVSTGGWQKYIAIFGAGNDIIYAIGADGNLYWYRHTGQPDGTTDWSERKEVGAGGWQKYTTVFATGNILYAIDTSGNLYWYRHTGQPDGTKDWSERQEVGTGGWEQYLCVFAAGDILYATHPAGNLYRYRHTGQQNGTADWSDRQAVGLGGWEQYVSVFATGDIIYATHPDGNLYWYRHTGQQKGTADWSDRQAVGLGGWLKYKSVFAAAHEVIYGASIDTTSWMSGIPLSLKLSQCTIPGTHDTGTWTLPELEYGVENNAKCQTLSLEEQLNAGIRFIDVRVTQATRNGKPDFQIYHAHIDTGLWFSTDILDVCKTFLANHPSETIIMSFKDEFGTTDNFEPHLLTLLDPSFCVLSTGIPSLKQARGHIVLFRRYEFGTHGIPAYVDWPPDSTGAIHNSVNGVLESTLNIQDVYGYGFLWENIFSEATKITKIDQKWSFVEPYLHNAAAETHDKVVWINFASASGPPTIMNPMNFAMNTYMSNATGGINQRIYDYLGKHKVGHYGLVILDYPEWPPYDETVVKRLIRTNLGG
jgi:hypothetical protein